MVEPALVKSPKTTPEFVGLNDLLADKVGGKVIFATDDWFSAAENLIKSSPPVWKEGVFTEFGKWMDGWESRRKRCPGHDWSIIQLGVGGRLYGFDVDTSYFTGNYAPRVSIQAADLDQDLPSRNSDRTGTAASTEELEEIAKLKSKEWPELLPMTPMQPGYESTCHNFFKINNTKRWTHLRLNMFPDGGIARLRAYGKVLPDWSAVAQNELIDLAAMVNGGVCVGFSNAHYGNPRNLIGVGRASNMGDGWETARRLDRPAILEADEMGVLKLPGNEWAEFKLGHPGTITKVEIDTNHFKGNFPDSCYIEGCFSPASEGKATDAPWRMLLTVQKLSAHKQHIYETIQLCDIGKLTHVRLTMAPDGGISRMRLWGHKSAVTEANEQ